MAPKIYGNQTKPSRFGSKSQTKGPRFAPQSDNFVESLRDIGQGTFDTFKDDLVGETSKDFFRQLFGFEKPTKASGDLMPGQSIEIDSILEAEREENKLLREQLALEKNLRESQQRIVSQETQDLKLQLKALQEEVLETAKATTSLAKEVQVAAMQAPVEPGVYHVNFFQDLIKTIKAFRKRIENAGLWLQTMNARSAKRRSFWGQVGMSGAKRLLSSEDYSQRSAG